MKTTTAQNKVKRNLLLAAMACVLVFPLTVGAIPIDSTVILEDNTDDGADAEPGEAQALNLPCPCCGGRMIVIETFAPSDRHRHRSGPDPPTCGIDNS